jgi:hypothetical protein
MVKNYIRKFMPFGGNEAKFLFRIDGMDGGSSVFFLGGRPEQRRHSENAGNRTGP